MSTHSACDECFRRKRKCHSNQDSAQCVRCQSLSLPCTRVRRQRRIGRPPNAGASSHGTGFNIWELPTSHRIESAHIPQPPSTPTPASPNSHSTELQVPPDHSGESHQLLLPHPKDDSIYEALDIWMFGSTFAHDFHRAINYCRQNSPWLLHEMFTTMDTFLDWARFSRTSSDRVDIEGGARSLQKLRTAEVTDSQDALAILMLGQALAAFDAFVTSAGTRSILRYSLSLVKPWYSDFAQVQFLDPVTISPIFWDIIDSMVHREVPVIKPELRGPLVVDRLAGLCTSLLPTLYDLSLVAHDMRQDPDQARRIDSLEVYIRQWNPDHGNLESLGFSAVEVASIRTQAVLYRLAGLLLIHRLRHPLTSHDDTAVSLANGILDERTAFFTNQGSDVTLQNAGLPVFLALLEVPLPAEDVWKTSTRLRVRPSCVDKLNAFYQYFWEQKLAGFNGSLFELVDRGPEFTVLP